MKTFTQTMKPVLLAGFAALLMNTAKADTGPLAAGTSDSSISGTVFHADKTTPLNTASVNIYQWNNSIREWEYAAFADTDWKGRYVVPSLPSGKYRLMFYDSYWGFTSRFYDGTTEFEDSTEILLDGASAVADIDGWLGGDPVNGTISGRVTGPDGYTPLASVKVRAYRCDSDGLTWSRFQVTTTCSDGTYSFSALPFGHYRIGFEDTSHGYPARFYPNAADIDSAVDVTVKGNTPSNPGIDVFLGGTDLPHGSISGTVVGPDGTTPLYAVAVSFAPLTGEFSGSVSTDKLGRYRITSLPKGSYLIGFQDSRNGYPVEYYDDESNRDDAHPVVVQVAEAVSGINAVLGGSNPPAAGNTLRSLSLSAGNLKPDFSPDTTKYSLTVKNSIRRTTVTPTPSRDTSKVRVNGTRVTPGKAGDPIPLAVGKNTIRVQVVAKDGSQKTYTVVVTRKPSSNNRLAKLTIRDGTLDPVFTRKITTYQAIVPKSRSSIRIKPFSDDKTATIKIAGKPVKSGTTTKPIPLKSDKTVVKVLVIAQNGAKKTYTLTVKRM